MTGHEGYEFIDVQDFTRNATLISDSGSIDSYSVTGDGVFDEIMETLSLHIQSQFKSGRIKQEQFASIYTQLTAEALKTAVQLIVQKPIADKQEELLDAQIATEKAKLPLLAAQVASEEAKKALYERQTKGYDDDAKQKILKILLDVWGLAFSVAKTDPSLLIPESMNKKTIDSLVRDILKDSNLGANPDGSIGFFTDPFNGLFT